MQFGEEWRKAYTQRPVKPVNRLICLTAVLELAATGIWYGFFRATPGGRTGTWEFGIGAITILDALLPVAILSLIVWTFGFHRVREWPGSTLGACCGCLAMAFLVAVSGTRGCGGLPMGFHLGWLALPGQVAELLLLLLIPVITGLWLAFRAYDAVLEQWRAWNPRDCTG